MVTEAKSRDVALPHGAGTMALITLDNGLDHTRPNTFGPRSLASLNAAIDAALDRDDVIADRRHRQAVHPGRRRRPDRADRAARPRRRAADRPARATACSASSARAASRRSRFVNGLALGGGLEVALHCTYRTVQDSAPALGLPEVMLGLVPGWGGAYLVPNLVGAATAVKLILENPLNQGRTLGGHAAFEAGLADAEFQGADFLEQSLLWAAQVLTGDVAVERPEVDRGEAWDAGRHEGPRRRGLQDRRRLPRGLPRAGPDRRPRGPRPATRASPPRTRRSPT